MFRALPDAVERISSRTPLGSALRTREWQELVPAEIRDQAMFSAGVESARVLETMQRKLLEAVSLQRQNTAEGGVLVSRDEFVAKMKNVVAEEGLGTGEGGLTDISSAQRLRLIYDTQVDTAHAYARHVAGQDEDLLDAFPAQELIRVENRETPRDWQSRWTAAGGKVFGGRMIALKADPVWAAISRFGRAFPPFDFGSGMGVEDVSRTEAEKLGLLKRGAPATPAPNTGMGRPEAASLGEPTVKRLQNLFGDQMIEENGRLRLDRAPIRSLVAAAQQPGSTPAAKVNLGQAWPTTQRAFREAFGDSEDANVGSFSLEIDAEDVKSMIDRAPAGEPIKAEDIEQIATVWRTPDAVLPGREAQVRVGKRVGPDLWIAELARMRNRTFRPISITKRKVGA